MTGITIGSIRGIAVRINISVFVIGALIAWSLAEELLPDYAAGYSSGQYWAAAAIATIAFFAGLVAHEFGHALVARRHNVAVRSVTLWLFGGVTELEDEAPTPHAAVRIAAAGPAVSLGIGLVAAIISPVAGGLVRETLIWFAAINVMLALFNLIPAFPLDGGRLFQAWRWHRLGDRVEATDHAAGLGLLISGMLIGIGVLQAMFSSVIGGVWMVLIGLFLREAARAEVRHAHLFEPLAGLLVGNVMTPNPITVNANTMLSGFAAGLLFGGRHAAYPVVDDGGSTVGLITLNTLRSTGRDDWTNVAVRDVMTPRDDLVVLDRDLPISQALVRMGHHDQQRAVVLENETLVGVVAPSDIARLVTVVEAATMPNRSRSSASASARVPS